MTNEPTAETDPENWATSDEEMTGAQQTYLETLAPEAGGDLMGAEYSSVLCSQRFERAETITAAPTAPASAC
jgi:hypothetical protein